jgi:hypothetical protein
MNRKVEDTAKRKCCLRGAKGTHKGSAVCVCVSLGRPLLCLEQDDLSETRDQLSLFYPF